MMRNQDRDEQAEDSDQEVYNEAEDEDFNPEQQDAEAEASSSDEDAEQKPKNNKRKSENLDELDSGDEATIRERKSKKRKKDDGAASDEEGGLIKTRAQRLAEKIEKKQHKKSHGGKVTINVDEIWADLAKLPIGRSVTISAIDPVSNDDNNTVSQPEKTIKIKRRIKFAGQVTEVEDDVAHDSAEAQAYIAEQAKEQGEENQENEQDKLNRPLRRFSRFEPNPLGVIKGVAPERLRRRAPTKNDVMMAEYRVEEDRRRKAEKLTTMQKTSLDWKGFVQEQGLGDELQEYGKSKKGFLAREQFLDRVHGANEVARRDARLKT